MAGTMVIAPHPDDETIGCGGTLLRARAEGAETHWVMVTEMNTQAGFDAEAITHRDDAIADVAEALGFSSTHRLGFPTSKLTSSDVPSLVEGLVQAVHEVQPSRLYLPFSADAHSDHRIVFDAAVAVTKWFRCPSVQWIACYEVLSETDFSMHPGRSRFAPNHFVDITPHLDTKIEIAKLYGSELDDFPFPRSETAIRAAAQLRGALCGRPAAEAFQLLKSIE